jgi:hypothetical protein
MFAQNPPKPASTFFPASSRPFPAPASLQPSYTQAGGSHQPELAASPAHPVTDVLQRTKGNNKKQEKQKAAAAQAKKSKQSKADRNAFTAARYGNQGRSQEAQDAVKELGKKGKLIAHGKGKGGSNTSNKFDSYMKEVKAGKKESKAKEEEEEYPEDYSEHTGPKSYHEDDDEPGPSGGGGGGGMISVGS